MGRVRARVLRGAAQRARVVFVFDGALGLFRVLGGGFGAARLHRARGDGAGHCLLGVLARPQARRRPARARLGAGRCRARARLGRQAGAFFFLLLFFFSPESFLCICFLLFFMLNYFHFLKMISFTFLHFSKISFFVFFFTCRFSRDAVRVARAGAQGARVAGRLGRGLRLVRARAGQAGLGQRTARQFR